MALDQSIDEIPEEDIEFGPRCVRERGADSPKNAEHEGHLHLCHIHHSRRSALDLFAAGGPASSASALSVTRFISQI